MPTPPLHDPTALAQFGRLEMVTRLLVEGYLLGQHKSPFKGSSVEFVEHRQYYPGDEIRHIDWRAFGKTGEYYIKEYEDETNLRGYLLVDCSGSMAYRGRTLSKFHYARQLAAAMAYLLLAQRDGVGLITFDHGVRDRLEPSTQRSAFQQLATLLEERTCGGETSLSHVFQSILPTLKRRSLVLLFTDGFDQLEPFAGAIKQCRHSRHELVIFQIAAPEEEEFPFSSPTQFRSLERRKLRILVDPHQLRKEYLERYQKHNAGLSKLCAANGVDYVRLLTTTSYQSALGAFLDARIRASHK